MARLTRQLMTATGLDECEALRLRTRPSKTTRFIKQVRGILEAVVMSVAVETGQDTVERLDIPAVRQLGMRTP